MHSDRNTYRNIAILGGGESGVGAALLAKKHGIPVFVSDGAKIKPEFKAELISHEIDFEENTHSLERIAQSDLVIKSPGISDQTEIIQSVREIGIPVVSEIEFAYWFTNAKIIAITGSNGKTTTTLLTGFILKSADLDVCIAGNVGHSFARSLAERDYKVFVLEVSSFQLDDIRHFRPDIAMILNITLDHLDRYQHDFQLYSDAKFRITENQTKEDSFIYCADDHEINRQISNRKIQTNLFPFSLEEYSGNEGGFLQNDQIIIYIHKNLFTMTLEQLALQGKHNTYNSLASGIAGKLLMIRKETIKQCLSDFQNISHRLEYVANVHGVSYYNDSKATNVNSTWYALETIQRPVVWIAGGVDKGNDYTELLPLVRSKVKALICLGLDNNKLMETFRGHVPLMYEVKSMGHAVLLASEISKNDDVVLLSPACASFDLFENYEDRGIKFKNAVKSL
jgi:UDP-N-acetylmuramoylalanine--D-glutamate ligase